MCSNLLQGLFDGDYKALHVYLALKGGKTLMKITNLSVLGLLSLILLSTAPFAFAGPKQQPTRISIVISNPPKYPQDVWVVASNSSGNWNGGGDICLVGGVLYALNKVIGEPLPPSFTPDQLQIQMAFKHPFDGGWVKGTEIVLVPGIHPSDFGNFFIEGAVDFNVLHGAAEFSPDLAEVIDSIKTLRFTFDYASGKSIQPVMFWLGIELAPGVLGYLPVLEAYPRDLMTVINTVE